MSRSGQHLSNAAIFLPVVAAVAVFSWPAGIIVAAVDLYLWVKWFGIVRESFSGNAREAICPNCAMLVRFRMPAWFLCPRCNKTLLPQGDRLHEVP